MPVARSPDINSTTASRGIVNVPRILNPTKIFLRQQKASAQAGAFFAAKMVRMRTGRRQSAAAGLVLHHITDRWAAIGIN